MTLLALPQPGPPPTAAAAADVPAAWTDLQLEQRAEREAEHARAADAEQIATAGPEVSIAQIFGIRTNDSEHGGPRCVGSREPERSTSHAYRLGSSGPTVSGYTGTRGY